jgi:TetR/AcrR family transcriptional regulator, mexJK operon transcriptional repressor
MTKTIQTEGVPETYRERILTAAAESFLDLGFERTSTAEIARRAKVSKREIYAYFDDKRAILSASITEFQSEVQSRMSGVWTSSEELEVVLPKAARMLTKYILSDRFGKLLRIVATESYSNPQAATQFFEMGPNVGRKATATYLKSQMGRGKLRKADPLKAADDFLDLVIGAQLMTAVILGQVDRAPLRRDHIKHAVEMFMKNYSVS